MARPSYYVPAVSRFTVRALYHEARRRKTPMTRLADQILADALRGTEGWREAKRSEALQEAAAPYRPKAP